ncbi:GNAT family N-acetyltransferase [Sphingomonas sp.]|uniref:GNAT family N-acetyltransferase n=1 Tax=Sphingomonas sp. TaxID=28214 RepID=UPI001DC16E0C|nr:GNAT family N-acetyltransferase [Sphingomonas sp.]MBX9796472.1 GNAT family N-acetyltransferase [Sphingomonas sp.]
MILRDATAADADALSALGKATFVETFGHLYSPENLAAFLETHAPDHWAAQLADPAYAVRVAAIDGTLVAYAKLGPPSLPFTPQGRPIELRQLYVLKPWHGTAIAPALMDWTIAEARARGADELYLSVFTDNHRARRFYERYGFVFVQPYAFMVGTHADEDHILRLAL